MLLNRRRFFETAATVASAGAMASALGSDAAAALAAAPAFPPAQSGGAIDWNAVRKDFPWPDRKLWLSASDFHPVGTHSRRAADAYYAQFNDGPDFGGRLTGQQREAMRAMFGQLIGVTPREVAFAVSTTDGENIVVEGLDLKRRRGNVVIDDLHYQASKFIYHMLAEEHGVEVRVVRHRADPYWRIDPSDMEKAIDRNTILVTTALVSNINGFMHDAAKTSAIAHANGAVVYADIIQGAGATPLDMKALGIDAACCGTYKWLGGDRGFAFLYVRDELQDRIARTRFGASQFSNPNNAQADSQFTLLPGAMKYECSNVVAESCAAATHASLKYLLGLGVENIRAHVKPLCDLLQTEMPRLGYPAITPPDNPTSVVSFLAPDYAGMNAKLKKAFGYAVVAPRRWEFTRPDGDAYVVEGVRISPSLYNNESDIHRLLDALA